MVLYAAFNRGADGDARHILQGHEGTIRAIAVSHDGAYAASASGDHTVRIWKLHSFECVAVCASETQELLTGTHGERLSVGRGHGGVVTNIAWSPRSDRLMSVGMDKVIRIWDLSGALIGLIEGHGHAILACDWAFHGRELATAGSSGELRFWELQDTEKDWTTIARSDPLVWQFAVAPHSGVHTHTHDGVSLRTRAASPQHSGSIGALKYAHNSTHIATVCMAGEIRVWKISPECEGSNERDSCVSVSANVAKALVSCAWNIDDTRLAVGSETGVCILYDVENHNMAPTLLKIFNLPNGYVSSVTLLPQNLSPHTAEFARADYLVCAGAGNTPTVFNCQTLRKHTPLSGIQVLGPAAVGIG
mmetsp:Transcript_93469/g.150888  ORF Transcript_93469/g.150888 Transcript_93469/m.150888 type:complete len:362 (+) Transcript_93469:195-1280(+)